MKFIEGGAPILKIIKINQKKINEGKNIFKPDKIKILRE